MEFNDIVKRNLQGYRTIAGYTQEEVAGKMGVTRRTIVDYENHPEKVPMGTYVKLADLYGIDMKLFFSALNFTQSETV